MTDEKITYDTCTSCEKIGGVRSLGSTPMGLLVHCDLCGGEDILPDATAAELARQRDVQVAELGAERVSEVVAGPLPTGPVRRLRHDEAVGAMLEAAQHAAGTPESVVLYLRSRGFELVAAEPVHCACPQDVTTGQVLRNPACGIHGDVDEGVGAGAGA